MKLEYSVPSQKSVGQTCCDVQQQTNTSSPFSRSHRYDNILKRFIIGNSNDSRTTTWHLFTANLESFEYIINLFRLQRSLAPISVVVLALWVTLAPLMLAFIGCSPKESEHSTITKTTEIPIDPTFYQIKEEQGAQAEKIPLPTIKIISSGNEPLYQLAYQWEKGKRLDYDLSIKMNSVITSKLPDAAVQNIEFTMNKTLFFEILHVDDTKDASFKTYFDLAENPDQAIAFSVNGTPEEVNQNDFKLIEMSGKIQPNGSVYNAHVETTEALSSERINIDIQDIVNQFFNIFPQDPIGEKAIWTVESVKKSFENRSKANKDLKKDLMLEVSLSTENTFKGVEEVKGEQFATVAYQGKMDISGVSTIHSINGKGSLQGVYLFSLSNGLLVQHSSMLEIYLLTGNNVIKQHQTISTTLQSHLPQSLAEIKLADQE